MSELITTIPIYALNGLLWGLIIALIALGLSLVFGLTKIINLAHGEFYMLGAVSAWYLIEILALNFWLAALVCAIVVGVLGVVLGRLILIHTIDSWENSLILTFALSLVLQYGVFIKFGGAPRRLVPPFDHSYHILGWEYPAYRLAVAGISVITLLAFWIFLYCTSWGRWIRAVHQNRDLAAVLRIPVAQVYWAIFGIGAALAALGGVLAAPIVGIKFRMGLEILAPSFMAVIVGGLGNVTGTVSAALLVGEIESLSAAFVDPLWARVITLLAVTLVLLLRPQGIFMMGDK